MNTLLIDIETFSTVDIKSAGLYPYVEDPDFRVLLFGYSIDCAPARVVDIARGEQIPDDIRQAIFSPKVVKVAHNMAFEINALSRYFARPLIIDQWDDTQHAAARMGFPLHLEQLGCVLNLPEQKMTEGKRLIKLFSVPDARGRRTLPDERPDDWALFKLYCARDVDTELLVARKLFGFLPVPQFERDLQLADLRINQRGVRIDATFVGNAVRFVSQINDALIAEARRLTGLDNPNSVPQLKAWLERLVGRKVISLNKKSIDDIDPALLGPVGRRVIDIRRQLGKTSLAKYAAMRSAACRDGRIRGLLQYYGAAQTGRFAGRLVQLQNLPQNHMQGLTLAREVVRQGDYEEFAMDYANPSDTLSELIRTAFIPSTGHVFHVCDFSAIEARVIAWLAGETWVLDTFRSGGDIYCATASRMFGLPVEKHGQNAHLRQKGKIATLALGYQGGVGALKAMGADRMGLHDDELLHIVTLWRRQCPHIVSLWHTVETAARTAILTPRPVTVHQGVTFQLRRGILVATLPSGRAICYPRARVEEVDGEERIVYERVNQTTRQWGRADTYGGKLTENLVQAIARDILGVVLLRAERDHLPVVFHVHDEIIVDCPPEVPLTAVEAIFAEPIPWAPNLPLRGAGYSGDFYYKD